ncbi:MAG: hypothetical protein V5A64_06470 [Candidatus Thermoplasmatota archaeon]
MEIDDFLKFKLRDLLCDKAKIKHDFREICNELNKKLETNFGREKIKTELRDLVIYDILDGSRSTLSKDIKNIDPKAEGGLFAVNLIHTLHAIGGKSCVILVHTSYNRERGKKEFNKILERIKIGGLIIEKYVKENNMPCSCVYINDKYEHKKLLERVNNRRNIDNNRLKSYFLFDYNEKWIASKKGREAVDKLPNIDVHIRHTKFQISGGCIPDKMTRSVFLYSQNGTVYTNWNPREFITLVALSLLAKILHKGEPLSKTYNNFEEIKHRYKKRDLELFNRVIKLVDKPRKLCIFGSPKGVFHVYF